MPFLRRLVDLDGRVDAAMGRDPLDRLIGPMSWITRLGSGPVCVPVFLALLVIGSGRTSEWAATVLVAEILVLVVLVPLRYALRRERPRPYPTPRWSPWNRYSFPSHHAARAWMAASAAAAVSGPAGAGLAVLAGLISYSRLVLRRHYLSDVLAGAGLGILAAHCARLLPGW